MKRINSIHITVSLIVPLLIFAAGCQKNLLDTAPRDSLSNAGFWKTKEDAVNAVNALYSFLPGIGELDWDMISDIANTNSTAAATVTIERSEHDANTNYFANKWADGYQAIRAVNYFLENADAVKEEDESLDDALLNRLKGEARFIRAFHYTRLTMLFGDVPLITQTLNIEESKQVTRTPSEQVWDFVESELTGIVEQLPAEYSGNDKGRITKGAALSMKARAMLYAGRWDKAAAAAKAVMDLNLYSLYPSYENLFSYSAENSSEVILDRQYAKDVAQHNYFNRFGPSGMNGDVGMCPTFTLVQKYETVKGLGVNEDPAWDPLDPYSNRDPRLGYSIFIPAFSDAVPGDVLYNGQPYDPRPGSGTADEVEVDYRRTKTGFSTKKYINEEDMNDRGNCGTNFMLIRYADVLLMYAEAKVEAGQIDQSVYDAINQVRGRGDVNMPPVTTGKSQAELRKIVRHERTVELALEGFRFFDLRRWKAAEVVMRGPIAGMRYIRSGGSTADTLFYGGVVRSFDPASDYLWPIPQQEIVLNSNLTQNPGY